MSDDVWDALRAQGHFSNLKKLVASFLGCDAVNGETTLNVVQEAEMFARFFNGDDIWGYTGWSVSGGQPEAHTHETGGIGRVCPDLSVDLD